MPTGHLRHASPAAVTLFAIAAVVGLFHGGFNTVAGPESSTRRADTTVRQ